MEDVFNFLRQCGVFYLSTLDNGKPRVRPFGTINIFDGKLYILTGKIKDVSKQIQKNPNVEICGVLGDNWLRVEGKLVRDERREAKQSMIDANPGIESMYSADDDNTEVLYFENAKATFSSFVDEPVVIKF